MSPALIDDQLLGELLRGRTPHSLRANEVYTTGYWYVRLCQAVLGASGRQGVLSRPIAQLPPEVRERATRAVLELPTQIGLLSLRDLAPSMAQLRRHHKLNILGIEALAAAKQLEAVVLLSARSPMLEAALAGEGLKVRVEALN